MDESRHIGIEGRKKLFCAFDKGDFHSKVPEIFRKFNTDKTSADYRGGFWFFGICKILDPEGVFNGTESKNSFGIYSRYWRNGRFCARSKKKLIIFFLKDVSVFKIFYGNGFCAWVYVDNFVEGFHFHPETAEKTFGSLESQFGRIGNNVADIIGKSAVCIGNISASLEDLYLRFFIKAANSCGGGGSAGNSSDNYNFHNFFSFRINL